MRPFCLAVGGAGGLSVVAKEERACACCDDDDDGIFWELLLYFFPKVVLKEFPYFTPPPPFPKTKELFFKISLSSFSKVSLNPSRIPFFLSRCGRSQIGRRKQNLKNPTLFSSLSFGFFLWSLSRHLSVQRTKKRVTSSPFVLLPSFVFRHPPPFKSSFTLCARGCLRRTSPTTKHNSFFFCCTPAQYY
jgi:hypothetical protein